MTDIVDDVAVTRAAVIRGGDTQRVAAYLPANYQVLGEIPTTRTDRTVDVVIIGHDRMGWRLDGYIADRLASGCMYLEEIPLVDYLGGDE